MTMAKSDGMAAVAELICRLNPYTNQKWSDLTQLGTGDMEVCLGPADSAGLKDAHKLRLDEKGQKRYEELHAKTKTPEEQVEYEKLTHEAHGKDPDLSDIARISIEVERNYGTQWTFKGQTQTVKSAFRIPYRFPVLGKDGVTLYWQTEYLLIGYAGGDGGA
jgi:hypothetical protein